MGRTVRVKLEDLPPLTDAEREELRRLADIPDEEIDFSDIPELTEEDFARGVWHTGHGKQQVTVRLDKDVLAFFKKRRSGLSDPHQRGTARLHGGPAQDPGGVDGSGPLPNRHKALFRPRIARAARPGFHLGLAGR